MSWYYNPAGQRRALYDRPLEPPDCWQEGADNEEEENMSEPELTFNAETHAYYLDGERVPSVTQLTGIFGPDPIQEGDPVELTMEAAADRGTTLHGYIEHRLNGGTREEYELPDSYGAYADGVDLFLAEHELEPMLVESPLHGEAEGVRFAGTPDFVGLFDGVLAVLDWKFVAQVQKTKVGAQLNGYMSLCLCNDVFPDALYCVQFLLDGTYRLYPTGTLADSFYLCLSVYREIHKKHPRGGIA